MINGRPVISSGQYGEKFSNMVITVDPDTKSILSMTNTIYDMSYLTGTVRTYNYAPDPALVPLVTAATAVPSYVLFWATAPETVSAFAATEKVRVTGVAAS